MKTLNVWPKLLQPRRMLCTLEYHATKYFAFANGKQPCGVIARKEHNIGIMYYKKAVCHTIAPKVCYVLKSASMPWKRKGMNVENRSTVFAKCVEIARPQCGEQEFSVLVAGRLTSELVKNIQRHSSSLDTGKLELLVTVYRQRFFSVFYLILIYTKEWCIVSDMILMT